MSEPPLCVDGPDDPRLSDYRFVRERDLAGTRVREGLFVGETLPIVERMLDVGGITKSILASERMVERVRAAVERSRSPQVPLLVASEGVLEAVAGFPVHRGVLAIGLRKPLDSRLPCESPFTTAPLILALDGVHNMDNVGAMFRCAAAFGVGGVLLSRRSHDPLYRKVIRVSMGLSLCVPFAWSDDLAATIAELRARRAGVRVVAADCSRTAVDIATLEKLGSTDPQVLVVGHEYDGISQEVLANCTIRARIPIAQGIDSLNAALAAGICLHRMTTITA